ncbi:MAG: hypothetical protein QHH75_13870 [Bacillota bacterium]|nr:hypothetical protein [Bacillota bacterium]
MACSDVSPREHFPLTGQSILARSQTLIWSRKGMSKNRPPKYVSIPPANSFSKALVTSLLLLARAGPVDTGGNACISVSLSRCGTTESLSSRIKSPSGLAVTFASNRPVSSLS